MSTFVERIKDSLHGAHQGRGMSNNAVVNRRDLVDLLHHFERLDSEVRARHAVAEAQYNQLQEAADHATGITYGLHANSVALAEQLMKEIDAHEGGRTLLGITHTNKTQPLGETVTNSTFTPVDIPGEINKELL